MISRKLLLAASLLSGAGLLIIVLYAAYSLNKVSSMRRALIEKETELKKKKAACDQSLSDLKRLISENGSSHPTGDLPKPRN